MPSQSGGLDFLGGVVFGPNGDLFVGSRQGSDSILRYDATTGAPLGAFVPSGSGGLDGPFDLAFGPDGNLYVSSWEGTHTIIRYDGNTGAHLGTFVAAGYGGLTARWTIVESGNANPTGITLDPSNPSHLWIVDNGTDRVYQYDDAVSRTSGAQAASASFPLAAGNTNPQGIADPPPVSVRVTKGVPVADPSPMVGISLPFDGIARANHTSNHKESSFNNPVRLKSTARSAQTSIVERALQGLFERQNVQFDRSEPERRENADSGDDMDRYQFAIDALMSESHDLNEVLSL